MPIERKSFKCHNNVLRWPINSHTSDLISKMIWNHVLYHKEDVKWSFSNPFDFNQIFLTSTVALKWKAKRFYCDHNENRDWVLLCGCMEWFQFSTQSNQGFLLLWIPASHDVIILSRDIKASKIYFKSRPLYVSLNRRKS